MNKKVLITGANGFVGRHLTHYLCTLGQNVWGTSRKVPSFFENQTVNWIQADLRDVDQVIRVVDEVRPDIVFHLAGQSNVKKSWDEKAATVETNVITTINLLEALKNKFPYTKLINIGSSEEYGFVEHGNNAITERATPNPSNPYGVSKLAAGLLALQYFKSYEMPVIHVRPFNHLGPGQALGFVASDFARQIAFIEAGILRDQIVVGNLDSERDFTDVRDIVAAYWAIAIHGQLGELYNVCSGVGLKISTLLKQMTEKSKQPIEIVIDKNKFRPLDVPFYIGNNSKLVQHTGWTPQLTISRTLDDILADWRSKV